MKIEDFIKPGMLHVRRKHYHDGAVCEMTLAYFTGADRWGQHLARIYDGITETCSRGGWLECVRTTDECTGSGNRITLMDATNDDIRQIVTTWSPPDSNDRSRIMLTEWLEQLSSRDKLSRVEIDRIQRIAKEYA